MLITLCRHEDGRPVAMIPATATEPLEISELRVCGFDLDTALFPGANPVVGITGFHCGKQHAGALRLITKAAPQKPQPANRPEKTPPAARFCWTGSGEFVI